MDLVLITLGGLFLLGLLTDLLGRRTPLPRVTLLILFGVLIGHSGLDLLSGVHEKWFPFVTNIALVMVGFLVGGSLTAGSLRTHGRDVIVISISIVLVTVIIVTSGLILIGVPIVAALLLGSIATSTDPAATMEVIRSKKSRGPFTQTLLGIVAIDDAWGLIVFSLVMVFTAFANGDISITAVLQQATWEIGGAVLLGLFVGIPIAYLSGRIRPGEPTQAEALGAVFLLGGLALWLEVSLLLAAMTLGAVVANLAQHHRRSFAAIEGIEWPTLYTIGGIGLVFVCGRVLGRYLGGFFATTVCKVHDKQCKQMGMAMLPQAGVAMGTALIASQHYPEYANTILTTVIAATVIFEVIGPILIGQLLEKTGECANSAKSGQP